MSRRGRAWVGLVAVLLLVGPPLVAEQEQEPAPEPHPLAALPMRGIGPALTSGRVSDFAVHPERSSEYFAAIASGGVWHTANDGTTWTPVFDGEGSYAIGVVEYHPANPLEVWVGTGENNAQRSVGFGDGVYKSVDGGRSWTNMGLGNSGHISQIRFDPRDPKVVWVAAQGPLWSDGGDRGLYRSADGGASWTRMLEIDPHTGVNELVIHPERPDHMLASAYQRRRHVWVLINGGPGSGIHKSTDGGTTWREITSGLPPHDMGRIGLAAAPSAPDTVYAIIETDDEHEGVYRSTDFGETWVKRSSHGATSPQYYNELVVDPHEPDRVYSLDTFSWKSEDGGASFERLSIEHKHVDDHALWIDPANTARLRIGSDGGIYDSWDRGQTWRHVRNLPITQFYRATPDDDRPFYNVYGGTQDNNTLGAPSRTTRVHGITNADWTITLGGDGFKPRIDPTDPNIVYSQYQYGGLARWDRRTGESVFITPQPGSGEPGLRWNWNSPLVISPHDPARLYYGAERLFRSDDRGNGWRPISGDLSRGLDRNALEVMGRVWSVDTIAKNDSTSIYGSLIALDESPLVEGLLYAGTDDGLIHVSEDGGASWRRIERVKGVPEMTLVEDLVASSHDADTVYAVFDNHKRGDHAPYVFRSTDRGRSWKPIAGELPTRGSAHALVEDHVDPQLLIVGTEFGLHATQDGGEHWFELSGLPTISVRDVEIQRRENDLVVATFGRGIWILDDISPLRTKRQALEATEATLFDVKDAWLYVPDTPWGGREKGSAGAAFFTAPNPPYGATFTYHLRDGLETRREARREAERELEKSGDDTPYPSWDELRAEDREEPPAVELVVRDAEGGVVRRVGGPVEAGLHRVSWDLRLPAPDPVRLGDAGFRAPWASEPVGPIAPPGRYEVSLAARVAGERRELAGPRPFEVTVLDQGGTLAPDRRALFEFQLRTSRLRRAVEGAWRAAGEMQERVEHLKAALVATPEATESEHVALRAIGERLADVRVSMNGDRTVSSRNEPAPWSIRARVSSIVFGHWESQAPVTATHREAYRIAAEEFSEALTTLRGLDDELSRFEARAESLLVPWTPGRLPDWKDEEDGDVY